MDEVVHEKLSHIAWFLANDSDFKARGGVSSMFSNMWWMIKLSQKNYEILLFLWNTRD